MRTVSTAALAKLSQTESVEPVNFVDIHWRGTGAQRYADQRLPGMQVHGKILELSNIEDVVNITGNSSSQVIDIKLDDSDGTVKKIMDAVDIQKSTVYVFQWFKGIPTTDAFIIFQGEISTPIVWNEADRTVSFQVVSKLEDNEVGFSAEEGDFEFIPPNIIGKAWPMVFGTVGRVPALQVNSVPKGGIGEAVGIGSMSQQQGTFFRIVQNNYAAYNKARALAQEAFNLTLLALNTADEYRFLQIVANSKGTGEDFTRLIDQYQSLADQYNDKGNQYLAQIDEIVKTGLFVIEEETDPKTKELQKPQIPVVNGESFPQGQSLGLTINGAHHEGVMNGNVLTITNRVNPLVQELGITETGPTEVEEKPISTKYQADLSRRSLWFAQAGSEIIISAQASYPIRYVASLLHTNVLRVWSKRNGILTVVPTTYYRIIYPAYGPIQATLVEMLRPLSSYTDEGWDDAIYCDIQSPVGPNVADILTYLINHHTGHGVNTASFNLAHTQLANYPANFALLTRDNIIKVLQDIAFQARCALWYNQGFFYIKYLPFEGTPVDTITDDDIEPGTFSIEATPTEEIVTKFTATWKPDYASNPYTIIFRHNIAKYGTQQQSFDFYIYNSQSLVEKSAQFWMVRKANTWKRVKFSTFLTKLRLETYDLITLAISKKFVANSNVTAVIEDIKYDSNNNRINITAWVPVRFGEMTKYPFAMPSNISETLVFPTPQDSPGGGGVGSTASGALYNQSPVVGAAGSKSSTRANHDQAANYHPFRPNPGFHPSLSDTNDHPPTNPVPSTYVNPVIDPSLQVGISDRQNSTHRQWQIKDLAAADFLQDTPGIFPGIVQGQVDGNVYQVGVYYNGVGGNTSSIKATQLSQREGEVIPAGTACFVCKAVWTEGQKPNQTVKVEYTISVPTWLPDLSDSDNAD